MILWLSINTILIIFLGFILYLVVRQIGIMLNRLGPIGARTTDADAPRIGENISYYTSPLLSEKEQCNLPSMYIFGSDSCPICSVIKRDAEKLVKYWGKIANIFIINDANSISENESVKMLDSGIFYFKNHLLREQIGIKTVPFAVIVDKQGIVLGRGLVNEISHLESLLEMIKVK